MYDPEAVRPMWEELANVGVEPLNQPDAVDTVLGNPEGTSLLVINSVCGCAAGNCRPGVALALQNDLIPDRLATVFAGVDTEAVAKAREHLPYQPSSPNIVVFQDGKAVHALQRSHIERMTAMDIATNLREVFNKICKAKGPSVPPDVFEGNENVKQCGSSIPLYGGDQN
jgi:putative YphP/YqiW family bacilliredoxin